MKTLKTIVVAMALWIAIPLCAFSNMASPIMPGTRSALPFTSRNVVIESETINIKPNASFTLALFTVEYLVRADSQGVRIPLLFHAVDYEGNFQVWMDDAALSVTDVPEIFYDSVATPRRFSDFSNMRSDDRCVIIYWENNAGNVYRYGDLKYFEAPVSEGLHRIKVVYYARPWIDKSGWITQYSFRYSLSPARCWRQFGDLKIMLDNSSCLRPLQCTLGEPHTGDMQSMAGWQFKAIPGDYFYVTHTPEISGTAQMLINAGPDNLTIIFAVVFIAAHLLLLIFFARRKYLRIKKFTLIAGAFAVPFISLCAYILFFPAIDSLIGDDASGRHGYTFMILITLPIWVVVYSIILFAFNRFVIRS